MTGASSGIGRKCAMDCAAMGARVILIGRNEQRLQETMLQMVNDNHVLLSLDLTNIELMAQKVKEVVKEVKPKDDNSNKGKVKDQPMMVLLKKK